MSDKGIFDLTGKVALITGASRGMGQAIALALAREGVAHVGLGYRKRLDEAERVALSLSGGEGCLVVLVSRFSSAISSASSTKSS
jgi:NAD(P)-dependent dehydrogenase (short-subunit alcohol dehydrogenase family)